MQANRVLALAAALSAGILSSSLFAGDVYLVESNPNAAAPYDSWATAATDYAAATAALTEGATLWVSNGTYTATGLATAFTLPAGSSIRSVNGPDVTMLDFGNSKPAFILSKANVTLAGLYVYRSYRENNGALDMTSASAIVTNCVFDTCNRLNKATIYLTAGTFVDCTVMKCSSGGWVAGGYCPRAVELSGTAVMDRCRITDHSSTSPSKGIVNVKGTAVVRNTLFKGNNVKGVSAVMVEGNGSIENCTIVDNVTKGADSYSVHACAVDVESLTASVKNTIIVRNTDTADNPADIDGIDGYEACLTSCFLATDGDPAFLDAANGDYHLTPSSPCLDQAATLDWMATAKDLDGNPRIDSEKADLGCYEYTWSSEPGALIFRTVLGGDFAPQTNEFRAVITPRSQVVDPVECWWTFDGTEPTVQNHQAVGPVITNVLEAGTYTIRFRTLIDGDTYGEDKTDWFEVKSDKVYLVASNPNAAAPYATWATAATSFDDAFQYLDEGMTLVVSNGTFSLSNHPYTIPKHAAIRSENGPENVVFTKSKSAGAFVIPNLGSVLEGITLRQFGWTDGGTVKMTQNGTVRNCIFDRGTSQSYPGGVNATMGTVVDCIFQNCNGYTWGGTGGIGASGNGPVVFDRCQFISCARANSENFDSHGAIKVSGGAVVRNSLIIGSSMSGCSGIYVGANGIAENCTVVGNVSKGTVRDDSFACYAADATSSLVNIISVNNTLADETVVNAGGEASAYTACFTSGDPKFANTETGDYSLLSGSPCIDQGTLRTWMDSESVDLAGHERVRNNVPDIGCYEFWESGDISVEILRNHLTEGIYAPQSYEFSVIIRPSNLDFDPENCWWTFDGTEPTELNHQAVGTVVTNVFRAETNAMRTVRFVLKVGNQTYADGHEDWIEVRSDKVFLVQENPNAAPPYATWETAATNFAQAFIWLGTDSTLWVSNGTYLIRYPDPIFELPSGSSVRSVNGPDTVTLDYSPYQTDSQGNTRFATAFNLSHSNTTVSGLRIANVRSAWGVAGARITAYTTGCVITNCIFDSCQNLGNDGAAIFAENGTVVDCLVTNCSCTASDQAYNWGTAVELKGEGTLCDRCRIFDSRNNLTTFGRRGAVSVINGATLRNSLVAGCHMAVCSGVYAGKDAVIENCTVAGNTTPAATVDGLHDPAALYIDNASAVVRNTIAACNVDGEGTAANVCGIEGWESQVMTSYFGTDPLFKNPAAWNFHLKGGSPCVNTATELPWMEDSFDLDGQPRLPRKGDRGPDMGCYEKSHFGMTVLFR